MTGTRFLPSGQFRPTLTARNVCTTVRAERPGSEETATRRAPSGSEETQPGRDDETLIGGRRSGSSRLTGSSASRDAQCIVPGTSLASTRRWRTIPSSSRSSFRFHSSALFLARLAPRHDLQQALDCRHRERLNRGPSSRAARARGWVGRCRSRTVTTSAMGNDMRHLQEGVGPRGYYRLSFSSVDS